MDNVILHSFLDFWYISFPLSIYILYFLFKIITEFLDLIFNYRRINTLLKHSDNLDFNFLETEYKLQKGLQTNIEKSYLVEMERQLEYVLNKNKINLRGFKSKEMRKIISAKEIADIFKVS